MERGTTVSELMRDGKLCKPKVIIVMNENEESWKNKFGDSVIHGESIPESWGGDYGRFALTSRTKMTYTRQKGISGGKKKTRDNSEKDGSSDDDKSEEERPKKRAKATKAAKSSKKNGR